MQASIKIPGFAALIACLVLGAAPAWAHAKLLTAVPAANSTLTVAPAEIALTFNENIKLIACTVADKDGKDVSSVGPARAEGAALRIPVKALAPGQYAVNYRIAGDDGHVVNASMMFTIQAKP